MPTLPRLARSLATFALAFSTLAPAFADADPDARAARARRFVEDGMGVTLAVCDLPKSCRRHAPLRATQELQETGSGGKVDHRTLAFDGMEVELVFAQDTPAAPGHPEVIELTVTTSKWPVAEGLRIGTSRADVDTQNDAMLCYAGEHLVAIKWSRWWDQ